MSTYIYKNNCLYADTRKIINFPSRAMVGVEQESKVLTLPWCYIAFTGFPKDETQKTHTLKTLTTLESLLCLRRILSDEAPELWGIVKTRLDALAMWYMSAAMSLFDDVGFLALTRRMVYGLSNQEGKNTERSIVIKPLTSVEVIGSTAHAAMILLHNGVSPREIYPILRAAHAPTGETPEVFECTALSTKAPPWSDRRVWSHILDTIRVNTPNVLEKEKEKILDIHYLVTLISSYDLSTHTNVLHSGKFDSATALYRNNQQRETPEYRTLLRTNMDL